MFAGLPNQVPSINYGLPYIIFLQEQGSIMCMVSGRSEL